MKRAHIITFSRNRLFFFYTINTHFTISPLGFSKNACALSLIHSYLHLFVIKVANGTSLGQAALSFFDTCFLSTLRANTLNLEASCHSITKELDCWENFKPPELAMAFIQPHTFIYPHTTAGRSDRAPPANKNRSWMFNYFGITWLVCLCLYGVMNAATEQIMWACFPTYSESASVHHVATATGTGPPGCGGSVSMWNA